jgi:hypothetical protein
MQVNSGSLKELHSSYFYLLAKNGSKPLSDCGWNFPDPIFEDRLIYLDNCVIFIKKNKKSTTKTNRIYVLNILMIGNVLKELNLNKPGQKLKERHEIVSYILEELELIKNKETSAPKCSFYSLGRLMGYPDICCRLFNEELFYYCEKSDSYILRADRVFISSKVEPNLTIVAYTDNPESVKEARNLIRKWDKTYFQLKGKK